MHVLLPRMVRLLPLLLPLLPVVPVVKHITRFRSADIDTCCAQAVAAQAARHDLCSPGKDRGAIAIGAQETSARDQRPDTRHQHWGGSSAKRHAAPSVPQVRNTPAPHILKLPHRARFASGPATGGWRPCAASFAACRRAFMSISWLWHISRSQHQHPGTQNMTPQRWSKEMAQYGGGCGTCTGPVAVHKLP